MDGRHEAGHDVFRSSLNTSRLSRAPPNSSLLAAAAAMRAARVAQQCSHSPAAERDRRSSPSFVASHRPRAPLHWRPRQEWSAYAPSRGTARNPALVPPAVTSLITPASHLRRGLAENIGCAGLRQICRRVGRLLAAIHARCRAARQHQDSRHHDNFPQIILPADQNVLRGSLRERLSMTHGFSKGPCAIFIIG